MSKEKASRELFKVENFSPGNMRKLQNKKNKKNTIGKEENAFFCVTASRGRRIQNVFLPRETLLKVSSRIRETKIEI